jgi:peptidoglycan/xylan/chitin deacetylase (PgdA/CDA1 family)
MKKGGITFGAHTKSHPILTWLDDESLSEELKGSKEAIEKLIGLTPSWFSYPDGIFTDREERVVRELGFRGAVQTFRNQHKVGKYAVPRVPLKGDTTVGITGRFSRAMMEVTLADFNKRRIAMAMKSSKGNPKTI